MSPSRPARPLLRLIATVAVVAAVIPLSGCFSAQIPADTSASVEPSTTTTEEPADEPAGDLPLALSFAEGQELPSTAYIEWGDALIADEGWVTESADDGNGGWSYATADGACTAQFWQGRTSDVEVVAGDDSASSDAILAVLVQSTAAEVTPAATTGEFSYQVGGSGGVETRQITGQESDRTWVIAARAFATTGVGLYVIVDCTTGDAGAILAEVAEKNAVVVTP